MTCRGDAYRPEEALTESVAADFHKPQAAMLAVQGLRDKGQIQPGQKLLINGAGGGVGTFGVQIAKTYGIEVTGVDHPEKLDLLRAMGFDQVIDYTQVDFTKMGQRFDLILDVKTNRSVFDYLRALNPKGTYVTVGGEMDRILQVLALGPVIAMISHKKVRIVGLKPNKDLDFINALYAAGSVTPVIDRAYALREVPAALRYFGRNQHKGKIVITVDKCSKAAIVG